MNDTQPKAVVLRKVSQFDEVKSKDSINLSDLLILVQNDNTKKTPVAYLMDKIIDRLIIPTPYDIAVKNGFEGTEKEWIESLHIDGIYDGDFNDIMGNWQIVNGIVSSKEPFQFIPEDPSIEIKDDTFVLYRDSITEKVFTINNNGNAEEYDGIFSIVDLLQTIVGTEWFKDQQNVPDYYFDNHDTLKDRMDITDLTLIKVNSMDSNSPYRVSEPSVGEIVSLSDGEIKQLYFFDGYKMTPYNSVTDYITQLFNYNIDVAQSASNKLSTPRVIALTGAATSDPNNPAKFDGSKDIEIIVLSVDASKLTGTIPSGVTLEGPAAKLKTSRKIDIGTNITNDATTDITGASFDGTKDIKLIIKKLNAEVLSGTASIDISGNASTATSATKATKLANARTISLDGAATTKNSAGVDKPASFDGTTNITITVQSLDASKLTGTIPSTVIIEGTSSNSELANTFKLKTRGTSKAYLVSSTTAPSAVGTPVTGVADTNVYVDTDGKLKASVNQVINFNVPVKTLDTIASGAAATNSQIATLTQTDTKGTTTVNAPVVSTNNVIQEVQGTKVFTDPRARTGSYDSNLATYRMRNVAIGTSATPPTDATYGGSGAIYFQYT